MSKKEDEGLPPREFAPPDHPIYTRGYFIGQTRTPPPIVPAQVDPIEALAEVVRKYQSQKKEGGK
jgi:hypothetical protein